VNITGLHNSSACIALIVNTGFVVAAVKTVILADRIIQVNSLINSREAKSA
jgi:hypothetical protein